MENIIIRDVTEKDIPSIADIQVNSWKTAYKSIIDHAVLNAMNPVDRAERLKINYEKYGFVVAELKSKVVGFCRYVDSNEFTPDMQDVDCEITALYVKPDWKRHGIGTQLFQFVINEFRSQDKTKMILWCLKDNEPSKKFYRKMGGKIIQERTVKIGKKSIGKLDLGMNVDLLILIVGPLLRQKSSPPKRRALSRKQNQSLV